MKKVRVIDDKEITKYKFFGSTVLKIVKSPYKKEIKFCGLPIYKSKIQNIKNLLEQNKEVVVLTTHQNLSVAKSIQIYLEKVGIKSEIIFEKPQEGFSAKLHIVLGANEFSDLPSYYIVYQLEQTELDVFNKNYFSKLKKSIAVLDYSLANVEYLLGKGIPYKKLFYVPTSLEVEEKSSLEFCYYFYRYLLSEGVISFDQFYDLSSSFINFKGNRWCLGLPESIERQKSFDKDNKYGFEKFPALRHSVGWIGCGMSYKFMLRKAKETNLETCVICEDDVFFPRNFDQKLDGILEYLNKNKDKWDIFNGLNAGVSDDLEIEKIDSTDDEDFIYVNDMLSMVLNVYNRSAMTVVEKWDPTNIDKEKNSIDGYLTNSSLSKIVTTFPFLVGQKDDLNSTVWNIKNTKYNNLIQKSKEKMKAKLEFYYQKRIHHYLQKNSILGRV